MTEGISKRELEVELCLLSDSNGYLGEKAMLMHLIARCTELDTWLPIDENTPKDRELILKQYATNKVWIGIIDPNCYAAEAPTHYKLLPEDPK